MIGESAIAAAAYEVGTGNHRADEVFMAGLDTGVENRHYCSGAIGVGP